MEFVYKDIDYPQVVDTIKLEDLMCKHVFSLDSDKAKAVYHHSNRLGYEWCKWGSHSNTTNIAYQLGRILKMETDGYQHAIRIVVCRYPEYGTPVLWTDNLHSTIKAIREHGSNVTLRDVPYYVINLNGKLPEVLNVRNSLRDNISDIKGAIESAERRVARSDDILRAIDYRVKDFIDDNPWALYTSLKSFDS